METVNIDYKGFVLSHLKVALMSREFIVNVGSDNPQLHGKLALDDRIVVNPVSIENALAEAKHRIDRLLQAA